MQKWEYKVVANVTDKKLNQLGLEGWELVALDSYIFYFKRPLD